MATQINSNLKALQAFGVIAFHQGFIMQYLHRIFFQPNNDA